MRNNMTIAIAIVTTLAVSVPALAHRSGHHRHSHWDDRHEHRHGHKDKGIAIAIGAAALIAIAATAKAHENSQQYRHQYSFDTRHNAIARCLHQAQRWSDRRGAYGVTFRNLDRAKFKGGDWRIGLRVKVRWDDGSRSTARPYCRISGQRIVEFRMREINR